MTASPGETTEPDKPVHELSMTERLSESDIGTRALKGAIAIELYRDEVAVEQQWSTILKEIIAIFDSLATKTASRRPPHFAAATLKPIVESWLTNTGLDGEAQPSDSAADFCALLAETASEVLAGVVDRNDPRLAVLHNVLTHIHQEIGARHQPERYRI